MSFQGGGSFVLPDYPSQKRQRPRSLSPEIETTPRSDIANQLWVDKYEPRKELEIAVKPSQVGKIRAAIENSSIGKYNGQTKILILKGPTGCGKSTLIRLLSKSMNYDLIEWTTEVDSRAISFENGRYDPSYVSPMTQFEYFLNQSVQTKTLSDPNTITPQSQDRKKIILLDDIPDLTTDDVKSQFQSILQSCLTKSGQFLLVLVVTDAWMDIDSGRLRESRLNNAHNIIPTHFDMNRKVDIVEFNPIIRTSMERVLKKIVQEERSNVTQLQLDDLIETANGDIRSAINTLQFYSKFSNVPDSSKRKLKKRRKLNDVVVFEDHVAPLTLFHAVGKVVHAKRNRDGSFESKPESIMNKLPVHKDLFIQYLNQNCLEYMDDIESCAKAMSYMSDADCIRSKENWQDESGSIYRALIAINGLMLNRKKKVNLGFRQLEKPEFTEIQYKVKEQRKAENYEAILRDVAIRSAHIEQEELEYMEEDPIESFSEDDFDDDLDFAELDF